jgi:(p)ppGpp synthase/HD superfamily hydrolase
MDPDDNDPITLTNRFEEALKFATRLHTNQKRKGTRIPYIAHLLGVTALVLENGGGEDEAIAALLHDAVEDQGGVETLDKIRNRFGEQVALIVDALTDSYEVPKPNWRERKEDYLTHLKHASPEIRRISLADKLHNARSILATLQTEGDKTWSRFSGGKDGTMWYYNSLVSVFSETGDDQMTVELSRVVSEINQLAD